jgi:nitrous oxide reductase accessory protein NosL
MNKSLLMAALVAAVALAACGKKEEAAPATAPTVATPAPAASPADSAASPAAAASPAMAASQ